MRILSPFLMVAALIAAVVSMPQQPALAANDPRFGVVQGYESWEMAKQLGIGWQRMHFWWEEAQPNGPGDWRPFTTTSDADIAASNAAGIRVVGVIGTPPRWATNNSGSVPANLEDPNADNNYFAKFVERLAQQYRGRVDHWIIWNEPDIEPGQPGATWGGLDYDYFYLLRSGYLAAKRGNPNARIGFAGTTIWADQGKGIPIFFERVLRITRELDPRASANNYYFDFAPVHVYTNSYNMFEYPRFIRQAMARYGLQKEVWLTEANVVPFDDPTVPMPRNEFRSTQQEQADFVLQGTALAVAANVDRLSIYKMQDTPEGNVGEPYGLVRKDNSPRPAYAAYQTAIRYLSNMGQGSFARKANHDQVTFRAGSRQVTVLWNPNGADTTTEIRLVGTRAQVIDRAGTVRSTHTASERGASVIFSLPRATATDGGPGFSIGGPTFLLVEEGVGDGILLSGNRLYYPITGYAIGGAFLEFYRTRGGLEFFGYPRSNETTEDGQTVQYFQRARMEFVPPNPATPGDRGRVQLTLINDILNGGRDFPDATDTTTRAGYRYFPETRHSVQGRFLQFFETRGGLEAFGYPVSQEITQPGGKIVQHFQRMRMEFEPGWAQVQLGLVGDEWMIQRGLLKLD